MIQKMKLVPYQTVPGFGVNHTWEYAVMPTPDELIELIRTRYIDVSVGSPVSLTIRDEQFEGRTGIWSSIPITHNHAGDNLIVSDDATQVYVVFNDEGDPVGIFPHTPWQRQLEQVFFAAGLADDP